MILNSRPHTHHSHQMLRLVSRVPHDDPSFANQSQGWSILIQSQQVLVSATQFIGDLNKCLASQSGMYHMFERMQQLDAWTNSVIAQVELLPLVPQTSDFGDHNESITAQSIRAISRIKLCRYVNQNLTKNQPWNQHLNQNPVHKLKLIATAPSPTSHSSLKSIAT